MVTKVVTKITRIVAMITVVATKRLSAYNVPTTKVYYGKLSIVAMTLQGFISG